MFLNEWGGGQRVEGEEEIASQRGRFSKFNSEGGGVMRDHLGVEYPRLEDSYALDTKDKASREGPLTQNTVTEDALERPKTMDPMAKTRNIHTKDNRGDNHENLRKRAVVRENNKRRQQYAKPGIENPIEQKTKKEKKMQEAGPKNKRKSKKQSNNDLAKERLQLRFEVKQLKEQGAKLKKAIKRANKRNLKGKTHSKDTEGCNDKLAAFTSLVIGLAPNVIKQVGKFLFSPITHSFR